MMLEMSILVFEQGVLQTELEKKKNSKELLFFGTVREVLYFIYEEERTGSKERKKGRQKEREREIECAYDTHIINNEEKSSYNEKEEKGRI